MEQKEISRWKWWTDTMEAVRMASGKIYQDQLLYELKNNFINSTLLALPKEVENAVDYLSMNTPMGKQQYFLKADPLTGEIYSIPSQRDQLDSKLHEANPNYKYNHCLYMDQYVGINIAKKISFKKLTKKIYFPKVFSLNHSTMELTIDLTLLPSEGFDCFDSFNLEEIAQHFLSKIPSKKKNQFHIGEIRASHMIFSGHTNLSFRADQKKLPFLCKGACFEGATFIGPFHAYNLTFAFDSDSKRGEDYSSNKVDFRNARFFDRVSFQSIRFIGKALDMEISFEDARFQKELEFINVDFGHGKVNFFQSIMGGYVYHVTREMLANKQPCTVRLFNIDFAQDAQIDFSDAEMNGTNIVFENIPYLPLTRFCLAPIKIHEEGKPDKYECPNNYLQIKNCGIQQKLYIGNVQRLSFQNSSNYGRIVKAENWAEVGGMYRRESKGLGKTKISDPILLAVYNNHLQEPSDSDEQNYLNYTKAHDFIMLKENYRAAGMYDQEDEAFILYMEYKPYIDSMVHPSPKRKGPYKKIGTNLMYKVLYAIGKYGISPGRVIMALLLLLLLPKLCCLINMFLCGMDSSISTIWISLPQSFKESFFSLTKLDLFMSLESMGTEINKLFVSFLVGYFSVAVVRKTLR